MSFVQIDPHLDASAPDAAWLDAHWMPLPANRQFRPTRA